MVERVTKRLFFFFFFFLRRESESDGANVSRRQVDGSHDLG